MNHTLSGLQFICNHRNLKSIACIWIVTSFPFFSFTVIQNLWFYCSLTKFKIRIIISQLPCPQFIHPSCVKSRKRCKGQPDGSVLMPTPVPGHRVWLQVFWRKLGRWNWLEEVIDLIILEFDPDVCVTFILASLLQHWCIKHLKKEERE